MEFNSMFSKLSKIEASQDVALLANEAVSHLQLQIEAIYQVLCETGYLQNEQVPVTPDKIHATPVNMHVADPPSPTLEGLSTLSLQLLEHNFESSTDSPSVPQISYTRSDSLSSSIQSFELPFETQPESDSNSLFNSLIQPISISEFESLDSVLTVQLTPKVDFSEPVFE
jgi:hypothetical protein